MSRDATFQEFMNVIRKLRSEDGCPWDRAQTHSSLRTCMLEEAYEAVWAIENDDMENLKEELGDVLLQVALHSVIAEQESEFSIQDVIQDITEKMIRRHPHVFAPDEQDVSKDINVRWEEMKQKEHHEKSISESMEHVPKVMPAALRAEKIQKKAKKAGLNFKDEQEALSYLDFQLEELKKALKSSNSDGIGQYYAQFLFAVINLSSFLGLNAENSLTNAIDKFINRLVRIERTANSEGKRISKLSGRQLDELWEQKNKNNNLE